MRAYAGFFLLSSWISGCGCGGEAKGGGGGGDDDACEPRNDVEECNELDDDCNGEVDEGFDLQTDPLHCGRCGNNCDFPGADATCEGGACVMGDCLPDHYDLDGRRETGCEYPCTVENPDPTESDCEDFLDNDCDGLVDISEDPDCGGCVPEICNGLDDNCNEAVDETFDLETDAENCGECGNLCEFDHATADCCEGRCCLQDCEGDWVDANAVDDDGCECLPDGSPESDCDGLDNDCDGAIDEDYVPYSCGLGACEEWSTCVGGAEDCVEGDPDVDAPDDAFIDADCDGIDGDESDGIFVSVATGDDANPGTRDEPVRTVSRGLALAVAGDLHAIHLSVGTFPINPGPLVLVEGIGIFGGYNHATDWSRSASNISILGGGVRAITAAGIAADTRLDLLTIRSANAAAAGASSMVIFATDSDGLEVSNCTIEAGNGRTATDAADAADGSDGDPGSAGEPGCEDSGGVFCTSCGQPQGGPLGSSPCGRDGGRGGNAGRGDNAGSTGGGGVGGTAGGAGGPGGGFGNGVTGSNGANGATGANGAAGASSGVFAAAGYTVAGGGNGVNGGNGNGGGGGGGGGGGVADCDSYGSSGGGGGGGGCSGSGATGGPGGGGSFALYLWNSDVTVRDCTIETGTGGMGGDGGDGGAGGIGGGPGSGGAYGGGSEQDDGGNGAAGGRAGNGGRGGHGGGGGGGPSICVLVAGGSILDEFNNDFTMGLPGDGGISTGNDGQDGLQFDTYEP